MPPSPQGEGKEGETKTALPQGGRAGIQSSSADFLAGFGTLQSQVAGLHRAGPSATLDKGYSIVSLFYMLFPESQELF